MENAPKPKFKRRILFIEKKFQAKFILKFCALVLLGGLLTVGMLYLFAMQSTTVSIVDSRVVVRTTADFLLPVLIQTVLIVTVIVSIATISVTLFISHKIAGPLYRFKKTFDELAEGDFSGDFRIRHLDQLQDLASNFNRMITRLREHLGLLKSNFITLKEKVDKIAEHETSPAGRSLLAELKESCERLKKAFDYFKC